LIAIAHDVDPRLAKHYAHGRQERRRLHGNLLEEPPLYGVEFYDPSLSAVKKLAVQGLIVRVVPSIKCAALGWAPLYPLRGNVGFCASILIPVAEAIEVLADERLPV
jgi:hypothetical protein